MNDIVYAAREALNGTQTAAKFEILVPDKAFKLCFGINEITVGCGSAAVIPPLSEYAVQDFAGIRLKLDKALLPFESICAVPDEADGIKRSAEQAVFFAQSDLPKKQLILAALGDLTAAYLIAFSARKEFSPTVELVRAQIENGVSDCAFSLEDSLKNLPLNYDYIRKMFQKETGLTPRAYLLWQRMQLAQNLLDSGISNKFSNYTISQIAEACGYSDPLYFSRVFKKYFGVSPSEYK